MKTPLDVKDGGSTTLHTTNTVYTVNSVFTVYTSQTASTVACLPIKNIVREGKTAIRMGCWASDQNIGWTALGEWMDTPYCYDHKRGPVVPIKFTLL